jgi:adenylate kinase
MHRGILLFGYPGSGKGTQGKLLGMLPGFHHIAMGDIFRGIKPGHPLYDKVSPIISKGNLVSDELTMDIFMQHVDSLNIPPENIVIVDGVPRNGAQAEILKRRMNIIKIFKLSVYEEHLVVDRLRKRAAIEGRADDADAKVIEHRLEVYRTETEASLKVFSGTILTRVQADQPVFFVHYDIMTALGKMNSLQFK